MLLDLLIENGILLTMSGPGAGILPKGSVGIKDGAIVCVGDAELIRKENNAKEKIDASGKVVMPGFVNAHTHSCYGMMSRGILTDITLFLEQGLAPYFDNLNEQKVHRNTSHHVLEGIKHGVTTMNDMGFHMTTAAKVYEKSGVRARLSEMVREMPWDYRDLLGGVYQFDRKYAEGNLKIATELMEKYGANPNDRISTMVCFQALDFVSEELIIEIRELAKKHEAMIHTHLAQSLYEIKQSELRFGCRPVEAFERFGILNSNTLAAHQQFNLPEENKRAAESGMKMAYCPYTFGRKGFSPPAAQYIYHGGTVGIGSDESCYTNVNPISDMKSAHLNANVDAVLNNMPRIPLYKILRMHTIEAAQAIGLGDQIGSLVPGKRADIIIMGLDSINMQPVLLTPLTNVPQNIVAAATGTEIETVIVDGKMIMEDRIVKTLDENQIIADINEIAQEASEEAYKYYKSLPDSEVLNLQAKLL